MNKNLVALAVVVGSVVVAGRAEASGAIAIDPNPIGFGSSGMLNIGGIPGEVQLGYYFITNTGTTALTVTDMTISGAGAPLMAFDDPLCPQGTSCPATFTVEPGVARGFLLTCVAIQPGTFSASLVVTSDATSGTGTVPMSCVGLHPPQLQVAPAGLDFGTAHSCWFGDPCGPRCNTAPLTQTLTITNTAPAPSEADISIALPPSAPYEDFTIDAPFLPAALAAGESIQITFTFHPAFGRGQFYDAPLSLTPIYPTGPAAPAPIDIPFHAHGGGGFLVVDTPSQLGVVPIGQTLTATVTAHNTGNSCLSLNEVSAFGDVSIIAPTPPTALLQAGESFTWTVACTPSPVTPGGEINFYNIYEGVDEPLRSTFYCHSESAALYTDPAQVAFTGAHEVLLGTSATQQLQVSNGGAEPTDLVELTSSDPHFTVALASGNLPVTLAAGEQTQIAVTFTPTDTAHVTGTIVLHGSTGTDATVAVAGDGVRGDPHHLSIAPGAIDLGTVIVGTTLRLGDLQADAIAIHNTDSAATFTISSVTLSGDAAFQLIGPDRTVLAPGERARLDLELTPTAPGPLATEIAIFADGDPSPIVRIAVTANAIAAASPGGCGCTTGTPASTLPFALAFALVVLRRRPRSTS